LSVTKLVLSAPQRPTTSQSTGLLSLCGQALAIRNRWRGHHRGVRGESFAWITAVLVVPVLLALMLLMEWLEKRFARRMVADQVAVAFTSAESADELEELIARSVAPLFRDSV